MNDPYENLEVAKLAAIMSGQLRRIDKETESSTPANRIDLRKFQQQVVNSANPHAARPIDFGGYQNQDEARMMEFLNHEALSKVPELIPTPIYTPPQNTVPVVQHTVPVVENIISPEPVKAAQPIKNETISINNEELIGYIKSIDSSLKDLCSYFIDADFKKNKKNQTVKKTKKKTSSPILSNPIISPLSKEMELELLKEINLHQNNIKNAE
jgi:hypothetical protein